MWNAIGLVQDLNSCRRVHFFTTITITPRAPPMLIKSLKPRKYLHTNLSAHVLVTQSAGIVEYANYTIADVSPIQWISLIWHFTASDGEATVLELQGMWSTCLLPLLQAPLSPRMVVSVMVPSVSQIELFNDLLRIIVICYSKPAVWKLFILHRDTWQTKLLMFNGNTWNPLTVCKQMINAK